MTAPTLILSTSGTDPKVTTKQLLEAGINAGFESLYNELSAINTGLTPAGAWNASSGSFPASATLQTYYIVSVAGTTGGQTFAVGDWLIPLIAMPSTSVFAANWTRGDYSKIVPPGVPKRRFATVAALLADTTLGSTIPVSNGDQVDAGGFTYTVVSSGEHVTTAGAVKLTANAPIVSLQQHGADVSGSADCYAVAQAAINRQLPIEAGAGTYKLSAGLIFAVPSPFTGSGKDTHFRAQSGFAGSIFSIAPASGTDPKNWKISDFQVTNDGSATNTFEIDIASAGEYVSKLSLSRIISNTQVSGYFVKLTNSIPNVDGLFTSYFSDNWSLGGYSLLNVGDSVVLERNTTTGAGVGYYVDQLATAANVTIRDGNCTSAGGALRLVRGYNLILEGMQIECPSAFTGVNNAAISVTNAYAGLTFNTKILHNSINTQGNPLYCIYLQDTDLTIIDGCNLYCDPGTGAHIYIDTGARNTVIGNNKYFSSVDGTEIDPIITNNGVGTTGVWVPVTIAAAGWTDVDATNEHVMGRFKDRDGTVFLRGRIGGAAKAAGTTLFTLPLGFRPKAKAYVNVLDGAISFVAGIVTYQILPTGEVQTITNNVTNVNLNGVSFSTK